MFQEAATVLNPAWAPPAEIVTGGRRGGSVAIGLRMEEGGSWLLSGWSDRILDATTSII